MAKPIFILQIPTYTNIEATMYTVENIKEAVKDEYVFIALRSNRKDWHYEVLNGDNIKPEIAEEIETLVTSE